MYRWVWMQKLIHDLHRRTEHRSTSFVGLLRDLNEIGHKKKKTN
jgi:hypothetical protein